MVCQKSNKLNTMYNDGPVDCTLISVTQTCNK